jgi:hypothetical protein
VIAAGRDLDVEVARKVFRAVVLFDQGSPQMFDQATRKKKAIPPYSTDTDTAYAVVRHYQQQGFRVDINSAMQDGYLLWTVQIVQANNPSVGVQAQGNTLAHAVCLAGVGLSQL